MERLAMPKRQIFYAFVLVAFAATAKDFARSGDQGSSKQIRSPKHERPVEVARYSLGRAATREDFAKHEYLIGPKGTGLPKGHGTAMEGRAIYVQSCAACHGLRGEGTNDYSPLVGSHGTLKSDNPLPTVGSYWPYATTVWDYINRAMPYQSPGTLKPDEVYAVTAYLLAMNGIVREDFELNERTLPAIKMPNRDGFVPDPRPDVK
jgi:S-disulfanyl-L-cysteine oxidoreductase SoxD